MGKRKGPWPQPAADSPLGMAAEVMHPLDEDKKRWNHTTLRNYLYELITKFPVGLVNWARHIGIAHMTDAEVAKWMTTSSYSKFLRHRTVAQLDATIFRDRVGPFDGKLQYLISDFSTMSLIEPYPGIHVAPTVSLFSRTGDRGQCSLVAIAIGHPVGNKNQPVGKRKWKYVVLTSDDEAWTLAKYFVIQGAGHMICLSGHPASHFPYDTINAVTTSALPMHHTLFRLLRPHLDLHLSVDHAVLEGNHSIVSQTRGEFYAPFAGKGTAVRVLVPTGYQGCDPPDELLRVQGTKQPRNYPRWVYPMSAGNIPSDYGLVLQAYRATVRRFVAKVIAHIHAIQHTTPGCEELHYIRLWADYIAPWLPGFPDAADILDPGDGSEPFPNLTDAVTTYIWAVAVAHSLEHATFHRLGPRHTSFRLRVPPPTSQQSKPYKRRHLVYGRDIFKATLAFHMFFKPHVIVKLVDVKYDFPTLALRNAAERFRAELKETEQKLIDDHVDVNQYIRVNELSSSIQY